METRQLALNNATLAVGSATTLPSLVSMGVEVATDAALVVAPISIGWVVLPAANALACM
jgi:hypothetical protein